MNLNEATSTGLKVINAIASVFPVACHGVSERILKKIFFLAFQDSLRLAAGSFNELQKLGWKWMLIYKGEQ